MSNFALRPINKKIIYKLLQKQKAFSHQSTVNMNSPVSDIEMTQYHGRTTWAHLIGLSVVTGKDDIDRLAIIGGGEFNQNPKSPNESLMRTTFDDIYGGKSTLYKPISGIKSISTRFEGTLKSRREATVDFTIFSLEDLDRLSPYFFKIGAEVLLEFGWHSQHDKNTFTFQGSLGNMIIDDYHFKGLTAVENNGKVKKLLKENTSDTYEAEILKFKGDYEYVLGQISNFDYSLRDDGGFDCSIKIATVGMSLLDTKINREQSPRQLLHDEIGVASDPAITADEFYQVMENLPEVLTYAVIENYKDFNRLKDRTVVQTDLQSELFFVTTEAEAGQLIQQYIETLDDGAPEGTHMATFANANWVTFAELYHIDIRKVFAARTSFTNGEVEESQSDWDGIFVGVDIDPTAVDGLTPITAKRMPPLRGLSAEDLNSWEGYDPDHPDGHNRMRQYANAYAAQGIPSSNSPKVAPTPEDMDQHSVVDGSVDYYNDGTIAKKDPDNDFKITMFVKYAQGETVQIFTGFNWKGSKNLFDETIKNFPSSVFEKFNPDDPTDTAFEKTGDAFLDLISDGEPPKTWVRWGWFEDNILSKYLGVMSKGGVDDTDIPISILKSVEPKVGPDGNILSNQSSGENTWYESNKMALPKWLQTTDVNEVIIPGRTNTLKNSPRPSKPDIGNEYNFYGALGKFLDINTFTPMDADDVLGHGIAAAEIDDGATDDLKTGYIRNLFIEVEVLKDIFINVSNLKEGLDKFTGVLKRNFGMINDFEIKRGTPDGMIGLVDKNVISTASGPIFTGVSETDETVKGMANRIKVFEFPAWEKESIVKKQDLKVTIPNSMALTALYAGNEDKMAIGNYDKSRGSVEVQKLSKFLKLDEMGEVTTEKSLGKAIKLTSLALSKKLVSSGNGLEEFGFKAYTGNDKFLGHVRNSFKKAMSSDSISISFDAPDIEFEIAPTMVLNTEFYREQQLGVDGSVYGSDGKMRTGGGQGKINFRKLQEYELEYDANKSVHINFSTINGLLELSLTIDGTAGIFPGNAFISKYLPKAWKKRVSGRVKGEYPIIFQAVGVSHDISPDGWSTTLTGMPRFNPKAFPYTKKEDLDKQEGYIPKPLSEYTGIKEYHNFFNINAIFAHQSLTTILKGINTRAGVTEGSEDTFTVKPGQIGSLKNIFFNEGSTITAINMDIFGGNQQKYADFTKMYNKFSGKEHTIPETNVELSISGRNENKTIESKTFENALDSMLFLQMAMIISGITYWSLSAKVNAVTFNMDGGPILSFYEKILADTNFKSLRPDPLKTGELSKVTSISFDDDIKNSGFGRSQLVYFSEQHNTVIHSIGRKMKTHDTYWNPETKKYDGNETSDGETLIGPADSGVTMPKAAKDTVHGVTKKYWTDIFETIILNEVGASTWHEFDTIIGGELKIPTNRINSKEIFDYALSCEYLILDPS